MGTITSAQCTSFKVEVFKGTHNFSASAGNTFKLALIIPSPTGSYGAATTNYSDLTGNSDEVSGAGYTAGGFTLTNVDPVASGTTACVSFSVDPNWTGATFSVAGALIYNTSASNKAVAVYALSSTQTIAGATFTLTIPADTAGNALIHTLKMDYAGLKAEIAKAEYAGMSDAQIAAALVAVVVQTPGDPLIEADGFVALFTAAEFVTAQSSADANVRQLMFRLSVRRDPLDLTSATIQQGVHYMATLGILTADRATAILMPAPGPLTSIAALLGFDSQHDMVQEIAAARIWS